MNEMNDLSSEQLRELADQWVEDADGILFRKAARTVLIAPTGEIYLVKGHDFGDSEHSWWFTVGGGINEGESAHDAAVRELLEETGLNVATDRLIGPVLLRDSHFKFVLETRRQYEKFFVVMLDADEVEHIGFSRALTKLELSLLDTFRWFTTSEIRQAQERGETFYPRDLADRCEAWLAGWDGEAPLIVER